MRPSHLSRPIPHQPEPKVIRRHANGAAPDTGIPYEIDDESAVFALNRPDAAVFGAVHHLLPVLGHLRVDETTGGPLPDVTGNIRDAMGVFAETAVWVNFQVCLPLRVCSKAV